MIDLGNFVNKMCKNLGLTKPRDILVVWQNLGEINSLYKKENEQLKQENEQLEIEAAKLRTIKDSYKKLLKDIHDTMREPIDISDYLIEEFGYAFADWYSCVKEDWEVEE